MATSAGAIVALGVLAAAPLPLLPQIPAQFSAPFQYEPGLVGFFHQDDTNQRMAQSFGDHQLPGRLSNASTVLSQNWSFIATAGSMHVTVNRVCRVEQGARYTNYFGWLTQPGVKFLGACTPTQKGCPKRACNVWGLAGAGGKMSEEICVDDDNNPVVLKMSGREFLFGLPLTVAPPPESVFKLGPYCDKPAPPCEGGAVQKLEAVVFHPRGKYNIAGQDVGDLLGDTFFLCAAGPKAQSAGQLYSVVSKWSLEVWSGFGQYALCNGYPPKCIGNEKFLVGREAATGFKYLCGQCSDNSEDVGSWFSLSAAGQCKPGQAPDGVKCSWRAVKKIKTVDITCPSFSGFFETCDTESSLPLTASAAKLAQIFAQDDIEAGGCPPITSDAPDAASERHHQGEEEGAPPPPAPAPHAVTISWANATSSKCIDLAGGNTTNGEEVQIWDCNGLADQIWIVNPATGTIQYAADQGKCLDNLGGSSAPGNRVGLWDCTPGDASQQWVYDNATQTITLQVQPAPTPAVCLDLPSGDPTPGNWLEVW